VTDRLFYEYIKSRLNRWGEWCEAHLGMEHGLPHSSAFIHMGEGASDVPYGDRILCLQMPARVMEVQLAVAQQPEVYREALMTWYVFHVKPGGGKWTAKEKAHALGVSHDALRQRVLKARHRLCASWQFN
jgi:hypothetical protein